MSKLFKYYGIVKKKGEFIFKEGDKAETLYMIHKGKVEINRGAGKNGGKLQSIGEGEFIGEMALINSRPRSANAIALEDCELIQMDRKSFEATIRDNQEFAIKFIQSLSARLRETDDLVSVLTRTIDKERALITILNRAIARGKSDQAGKWLLLKRDELVPEIMTALSCNTEQANSILNNLLLEKSISIKKDGAGVEWIACKKGE